MKLTKQQYWHALGLYLVARRKQIEVDQLEEELNDILGTEVGSRASDAVYDYNNQGTPREFDNVLRLMRIEVSD